MAASRGTTCSTVKTDRTSTNVASANTVIFLLTVVPVLNAPLSTNNCTVYVPSLTMFSVADDDVLFVIDEPVGPDVTDHW